MERLQNILAKAGVASRRGAAEIISAGRVKVDGETIREPGARFDPASSRIELDGKVLARPERKRTIILYKPPGVLSSMSDPFGGMTVRDLVSGSIPERLVPVGRLDKDSEGLLLMSNDGELTLRLTHPRYNHVKTYEVKVAGRWNDEKLRLLNSSCEMPDGYMTRPAQVKVLAARRDNITLLEFRLKEGRKRQIRYMCSTAHLTVLELKRVAIGRLRLPEDLQPGQWRDLSPSHLSLLT